ncbi:tyrosine-type recombinase/integrase [Caballeronia sp. TF1N1]|uniref:tyrosine-type recombinase/integrase n=1 Tax=Caballeronia sp. TF1N1 TaxID=2878153 RepID=UPI001FD28CD3|nr:tyrosine-type recombinase/integrase [Caballeronia sp. TF1N1]
MGKDLVPWSVNQPLPAVLERAGANAKFATEEYFKAMLNNEHTRRAYGRIVRNFLTWLDERGKELHLITPGDAGEYFGQLTGSTPTKNQALAALRHYFDVLVTRHAVPLNSFASVRGIKHRIVEGKTAELDTNQSRKLFKALDTSDVIGLRDRAVLLTLAYTGARVGAVAKLQMGDVRRHGEQWSIRFNEKGGKQRDIPVRHDLRTCLIAYMEAAGVLDDAKTAPLFRASPGRRKNLTAAPFAEQDIRRMMKRRLNHATLSTEFSPHSFRVAVVTDLLKQDVPLEDVQYLAGHSDPKTTLIYDRRRRSVTRNTVERISNVISQLD